MSKLVAQPYDDRDNIERVRVPLVAFPESRYTERETLRTEFDCADSEEGLV